MTVGTISKMEKEVHVINSWLKDIGAMAGLDEDKAFQGLKTTLQTLRDRLTTNEAADLGAQLPLVISGMFFQDWKPGQKPQTIDKAEFLNRIKNGLSSDPKLDPEKVAKAVFHVLQQKISAGEIKDVQAILPPAIEQLFGGESEKKGG